MIEFVPGGSSLCAPAPVLRNVVLDAMGLLILPLYRAYVGLVGTLARGETGTEKEGRKHERSFHGQR